MARADVQAKSAQSNSNTRPVQQRDGENDRGHAFDLSEEYDRTLTQVRQLADLLQVIADGQDDDGVLRPALYAVERLANHIAREGERRSAEIATMLGFNG